jgi:hypothetical protein
VPKGTNGPQRSLNTPTGINSQPKDGSHGKDEEEEEGQEGGEEGRVIEPSREPSRRLIIKPFREYVLRFAAVAGRKSGHCHFGRTKVRPLSFLKRAWAGRKSGHCHFLRELGPDESPATVIF